MKEVQPEKGLSDNYTEAEFDQAVSDGEARQNGHQPESAVESSAVFSAEDARQMDSITLMRIYDLLGALLTHFDEDTATAILEAHAEGKLVGPLPYLNI